MSSRCFMKKICAVSRIRRLHLRANIPLIKLALSSKGTMVLFVPSPLVSDHDGNCSVSGPSPIFPCHEGLGASLILVLSFQVG